MNRRPTFEQLREARELAVINPDNGKRFRVSLRDWEGCLWAIRVYPYRPRAVDRENPFVTAHRLVPRESIEDWLGRLWLDCKRTKQS